MRPTDKISSLIGKLKLNASADLDNRIDSEISKALIEKKMTPTAATQPNIWRIIMKSKLTKLATAAAVVLLTVVLSITFLDKSVTTAYAFEQTIEAFENVRYMHLLRLNNDGQIADERWIEIGPRGFQVRYRQDTPPDFFVVEDGETVAVYHKDKKTMVLWDPKDKQYQWIGDLRGWLKELAGEASMVIKENVDYEGQQVHYVRWLKLDQDVYIDPETKLPVAMGGYVISYEEPPEEIFDIAIPEGVEVVDKRPGAEPAEDPEWLVDEKVAGAKFKSARYALAGGEYEKAAELFESVVALQPGRNWAWFWMGRAHYELGEYDKAIEAYSKFIGPAYSYFARGLAYAMDGMSENAKEDIEKALPSMIRSLRYLEGTNMFDYADDPRGRLRYKPNSQQRLAKMINRLRMATGQNFGFNPEGSLEQIETVIFAWEQWYESSGKIHVNPEAELVSIPGPLSAKEDPYLTSEMTETEATAIKDFHDTKMRILYGQIYSDRSTPLRALLTMLSGLHARNREVVDDSFAIDASEIAGTITKEKMGALETYLATYDILRSPVAPESPSDGEFWPVYVKNTNSEDLADIFLFVFWNGQWRFCGNVGDPNIYWKHAVPKMREMLENADK